MYKHRIVSKKYNQVFDFRAENGGRIFVNGTNFLPGKGKAVYVKKGRNVEFLIADSSTFVDNCRRWYKNEMARLRRIEKRVK